MRPGDRVTVTVKGNRVGATVTNPWTELGNVQVELDKAVVMDDGLSVTQVVRDPADVRASDLHGSDPEFFETAEELLDAVFPSVVCRSCGCSEFDACVTSGIACHWTEPGLCSACAGPPVTIDPAIYWDDATFRDATGKAINMSGELVDLDTPFARAIARGYRVPDHIVGIPSPWWRRVLQRLTRR